MGATVFVVRDFAQMSEVAGGGLLVNPKELKDRGIVFKDHGLSAALGTITKMKGDI